MDTNESSVSVFRAEFPEARLRALRDGPCVPNGLVLLRNDADRQHNDACYAQAAVAWLRSALGSSYVLIEPADVLEVGYDCENDCICVSVAVQVLIPSPVHA